MVRRAALSIAVLVLVAAGLVWHFRKPMRSSTRSPAAVVPAAWAPLFNAVDENFRPTADTISEGNVLSQVYCSECHLRPAPSVLPRRSWIEVFQILVGRFNQAGVLIGPERAAPGSDQGMHEQKLSLPEKKHRDVRIPKSAFTKIVYAYLSTAQEESLPQVDKPARSTEPAPFKLGFAAPASIGVETQYTLATFEPASKRIILGDSGDRSLFVLDATGHPLWRVPLGGISPTSLTSRPDGLYVIISGPTYESVVESKPDGKLLRLPYSVLERKPTQVNKGETMVGGLRYPLHASFGDLDGDRQDDVLIEEFGMSVGELAWYQKTATGYTGKNILFSGPGSLASSILDLNGDGRPEVLALAAQADETVSEFQNLGGGKFERRVLVREQPAFGFDGMWSHDMDGDGKTDLVTVNGDNDLNSHPLRNYHGVRIWRNDGENRFSQSYFYPMYGAIQAVVRDFDNDGDLDIVAVSLWPDMSSRPFETAVFLENEGSLKFVPKQIPGTEFGKWAVVGAGDFDGDGDDDLILGALYVPGALEVWGKALGSERPLAYLVLENTTRVKPMSNQGRRKE